MFDIGFSEIVVIAVVALIVIGPERLPKAARTLGHLFGRLQRYVNDVKSDINREMELDELRKLQQEVQSAARDIETSVSSAARDFEQTCAVGRRRAQPRSATSRPRPRRRCPAAGADRRRVGRRGGAMPRGDAPRQGNLPGFDKI